MGETGLGVEGLFCLRFLLCLHSHLWNGDLELRGEDQAGDSSLVWVWMLLPMETVKPEKKSCLRIEPWGAPRLGGQEEEKEHGKRLRRKSW